AAGKGRSGKRAAPCPVRPQRGIGDGHGQGSRAFAAVEGQAGPVVYGPALSGATQRRRAGSIVHYLLQLLVLRAWRVGGRVAVGIPGAGWYFSAVYQSAAGFHDGRGRTVWRGTGSGRERDR